MRLLGYCINEHCKKFGEAQSGQQPVSSTYDYVRCINCTGPLADNMESVYNRVKFIQHKQNMKSIKNRELCQQIVNIMTTGICINEKCSSFKTVFEVERGKFNITICPSCLQKVGDLIQLEDICKEIKRYNDDYYSVKENDDKTEPLFNGKNLIEKKI